ncbi:MAG: cytochrome c biogenesis protein CcdA [Flavobacteriaceae bacterium]|nr:cytochrome c biogenesis protein CcdA [Flavobacteriaceae bacterium]
MRLKKLILFILACLPLMAVAQTEDEPVIWTSSVERISKDVVALQFNAVIAEQWHLYSLEEFTDGPLPTEFTFVFDSLQIQLEGKTTSGTPKRAFDEIFQIDLPFFDNESQFTQRFTILDPNAKQISGEINYQACDDRVCIFRTEPFQIMLDGSEATVAKVELTAADLARSKALTLSLKNKAYLTSSIDPADDTSPFLKLFLLGFLGGLIALLTPCVFPMIPLTVSFFLKQGNSLRQGILNALLYGFFIVVIYVLLSLPFHFLDSLNPEILNTISTNVPLNLVFFGVFVFFAFSFFGYYELTLPSSWGSATDEGSNRNGIIGIFFMALTLAIVSFSCTGPILGSLLAGSLTAEGGAMQLTAGMTGFGFALAMPFALFALFPNALNALPKSGGWMTTIKVILGFLELALALKFLSNADLVSHWGLLKREVFIGIWTLLAFGLTLYLFGIFRFPHDVKGPLSKSRYALAGLSLVLTAYLFVALVSKENTLKPLSGFPPPAFYSIYEKENDCPLGLDCYKDFVQGLAAARLQNKPILLDFTGWACVNCRKVEENVWSQPAIFKLLNEELVLISLYVDDRTALPITQQFNFQYPDGRIREINTIGEQWATFQSLNFNSASQPYYVLMQADGTLLNAPIQYTDAKTYLDWLTTALDNN